MGARAPRRLAPLGFTAIALAALALDAAAQRIHEIDDLRRLALLLRRLRPFAEIDAGIGGETAHAVGETLRRLAERAQVVTITHLPQIAALADRHFRVEKTPGEPTHTRIEQLGDDERKAELERMLGGLEFLAAVRG